VVDDALLDSSLKLGSVGWRLLHSLFFLLDFHESFFHLMTDDLFAGHHDLFAT